MVGYWALLCPCHHVSMDNTDYTTIDLTDGAEESETFELELPDDLMDKLATEAEAQGITLEEHLANVLTRILNELGNSGDD